MGNESTGGTPSKRNPWLYFFGPRPEADIRLFCLPYAGGTVTTYRTWSKKLPPSVEVAAVQLPGRGSRMPEPPFTQLAPLVEALARNLLPYLDRPFALFGHSMGALVAFELARHLRREHGLTPAHFFSSGQSAPQYDDGFPPLHELPDAELLGELRRLNGTPQEVLEHPELIRVREGAAARLPRHGIRRAARRTVPARGLGGVAGAGGGVALYPHAPRRSLLPAYE
jgi:medium-chain acyl-[acyl-carrier-protein] hydrolase